VAFQYDPIIESCEITKEPKEYIGKEPTREKSCIVLDQENLPNNYMLGPISF